MILSSLRYWNKISLKGTIWMEVKCKYNISLLINHHIILLMYPHIVWVLIF